MADVVFL